MKTEKEIQEQIDVLYKKAKKLLLESTTREDSSFRLSAMCLGVIEALEWVLKDKEL